MLFLPVKRSAGSQGLREKNTLFGEERRKGRFFPKQPEGLDLDGQAERAKFASFLNFENTNIKRRPSKMKDAFVVLD